MNKKCQVFTPIEITKDMLQIVSFKGNLFGKKILENSCGDGKILTQIIKKYIIELIKLKFSLNTIKIGLENDIYAFEIDESTFTKCLQNINEVAFAYGITNVKWKLYNDDYLKVNLDVKFSFIIGNPPYISYKDLSNADRQFIKANFLSCSKGKPDYCYTFIEKSIADLEDDGKLIYLIPISIFKNTHANLLRDLMLTHIRELYDYKGISLFKQSTSSGVMLIDNGVRSTKLKYVHIEEEKEIKILKKTLGAKWIFSNDINLSRKGHKFSNLFNCMSSVATQRNDVFLIKEYTENKDFICFDKYKIEKALIKNGFGPKSRKKGKKYKIIFPYYLYKSKYHRYNETDFSIKFPEAVNYLNDNFDELCQRDSDKHAHWFEYGRSQAIQHLNSRKLILSVVKHGEVEIFELNKSDIPYAGMFIPFSNDKDLILLKSILLSQQFSEYLQLIGTSTSGKSVRLSPKDINNYIIKE